MNLDFSAMNNGDFAGIASLLFLFFTGLTFLFSSEKKRPTLSDEISAVKEKPKVEKAPSLSWAERLSRGLSKSRSEVWGKVANILMSKSLDEESVEEIEELLYTADMSPNLVEELIEKYKKEAKDDVIDDEHFKTWTASFLKEKLDPVQREVHSEVFKYNPNDKKLKVFMIVGVNGAGKTTTIGKLATKLKNQGAKVVVGACDTFRAAAVEQLETWCKRAGVEMIKAKEGNDPSGVAYDTLAKAQSLEADYCLLDTAGRLHTKQNLMDELSKTKRVLSKLDSTAPQQVLLVVDSITGQNAIAQAEQFNKALSLTGLIFTKCDGSSKAGNAISIVDKLKVPITYIGVGEDVEDLEVFNTNEYLDALLS
ncbi:MAG: signal recognition particle-docking protein FtsY [Halobacteriovoraceae bacterium]|nr:signal recognition particle-docking protein FtsY [Halobacteriovoraceae bacterium]